MIKLYIFNVLLLLDIIYPQYIMQLDPLFQIESYMIEMKDIYLIDEIIRYGIWSKYNPLSIISQVGPVGLFDSNCFHYQNVIEQKSGSLDLIYYDCLYPQNKTIEKFLSYISSDGQQFTYNVKIDPFMYENFWYLFELLYWPFINKLELIIITEDQQLLHEVLYVNPFKEKNIFVNFGGGYVVQNSNINTIILGSRYSYFPGTILLYVQGENLTYTSSPDLDYINQARQDFQSSQECYCQQNNQYQILDWDIIWLDTKTFTSENINCDSFTFSGWYKIKEIHKINDEFTYQFFKIMPNFENELLSNPKITPFQMFYQISSNYQKIIITTYSYNFPFVSLDFTNNDNTFIINYEFDISEKIAFWHNLLVKLVDDQIFISINFYDSYEVYEYNTQFNVRQFKNVQFKLYYGNLLQSSQNYLNIQTRNQIFFNCQQLIEQQNCHYTCQDCDGPTKTDCLSCSEESSRIYLPEYKACICPYHYYDDQVNQNCKSYTDQKFTLNQIPIESGCKFGYFEFDDSCYICPSIISNILITCLECVQNLKGWNQNPYCQTTVYINPNGYTAITIPDEDYYYYYVFDGLETQMCRYCDQQPLSNIDSIYQDYNLSIQRFKSFCQFNKINFYGKFDINIYYDCKIIGCITCSIEMTGIKCSICEQQSQLINGICTYSLQQKISYCIAPYYKNSIGECKKCNLNNCKYCFEYNKNDLSICTLYVNLAKFDKDEYLTIGCALCQDNFIFDFNIGECLYKQPSQSNCIRSYINLQNQEICTLSSTDFSIAPEISNCNRFIQNCLQCLFTPQSSIRCIICQSGFTSSIRLGSCYPNQDVNAKIVIEGDYKLQDAWVQRVQSFMMKFLPDQYYYQKAFDQIRLSGIPLECNDGYQIDDQLQCLKYCNPECLNCQLSSITLRFYCEKCPLNEYYQPIHSEEFGECTGCPELCDVCQERTEIEIQQLNPKFKISQKNRKYTKKCIKPISNLNVLIDPHNQIAKYCYDQNCNSELIFEFGFDNCNLIICHNIDDKIDTNFINQIGIAYLTLSLRDWFNNIFIDEALYFTTQLKSEIFNLKFLKLTISALLMKCPSALIQNFDCLEINNVTFIFNNQSFFQIANQNQKVNLILNNIIIQNSQIQNVNSLFDTELFGELYFNNIQITNTDFTNSSFLNLKNSQFNGKIQINKMILENCKFNNSQLFFFSNNEIQIQIEQLIINQSQFYDSSFTTIYVNYAQESRMQVNDIKVLLSQFHQSYLFNTTQLEIIIINLLLDQNSIILSTLIGFTSNFTLLQTIIKNNDFKVSQFISTHQIKTKEKIQCLIDDFLVYQNNFTTSSLFFIYSSISNINFYFSLSSIKLELNQGQNNQYQEISLFNINCFQMKIDNSYIVNSINLRIFYLVDVPQIFVSNVIYQNLEVYKKVPSNLDCLNYDNYQNQLFLISGYTIVILKNINVLKQFSIDQSLIEIQSTRKSATNIPSSLRLINLKFDGNLLLHQHQANFFSLMTINSEKLTKIYLDNIVFQNNFLHQQIDDPSESSTSLIQIISIAGLIEINNFYCLQNALTNSSNQFISLKSEIILLRNYSVSKHNVLPLELWKMYYDFSIDMVQYDQEQINLIIQQTFKIKSKCGAGLITASTFSCFNCSFKDIIVLKSSVFEIMTQGDGNIQFINLTINQLEYDISQIVDSSGCITIYSSNSLLNLKINNAVFQNVFNRIAASLFTIIPSLRKNEVNIQDVEIINSISLKNPIINLQFSSQNINSNKVVIKNIKIQQYKDIWIKYFEKTEIISQSELQDIIGTSNALFLLKNCKVIIQHIFFQGIYACPLIKLINVSYLLISQLWAIEIQTFYAFSLLEINQDLSIQTTLQFEFIYFQKFKPFEVEDNPIFYNPKINYMISGCVQVENPFQNPIIYSFYDIINLMQQTWQPNSLIDIQTNSNQTILYLQNIFFQDNQCNFCSNGLFFLKTVNYCTLIIRDLLCNQNQIQKNGCINILKTNDKDSNSKISNSNFFYNNGSTGVAISSANMSIKINYSKILYNRASFQGGGLYLHMNNRNLLIKESTIIYNQALEGGGIFMLDDGNINQKNFIKSFLHFNHADYFANDLVEFPTHISLFINSQEMQSEGLESNNVTLRSLKLKSYKIIEQGIIKMSSYLMVPSNQVIKDYQIFDIQSEKHEYLFKEFSLSIKNSRNEFLFNIEQLSCNVSYKTSKMNQVFQLKDFKMITILQADTQNNNFDLGSISFHYNPYQDENLNLQILISCSYPNLKKELQYLIKAKSYKCQLGEFYVDEGCQICESSYGFYSVTYNATKCSIFDKTKFANITSQSIQLLEGFWRPHSYSDYIDYCFKNAKFCRGGWQVEKNLCSMGHIGGLCEECDYYNIRGEGKFFKNQQDSHCYGCFDTANNIISFILASLWAIISTLITLKSIEKSNQLFTSLKLKFKPKYSKILFKLDQDLVSIFIKIFLNYLWIFSVIFTFNIKFSLSFTFIDQFSNTSQFMAFSLDCYLSDTSQIELIYLRIIVTLGIFLLQFIIIFIGFKVYSIITKQKLDKSIISNTLLYLYVSNYAGLIKQFCSILSKRIISNNQYIQGDLTLIFGSQNHYQWIYYFALPGLGILGCCIPFSLFFLMLINKGKLEEIKLRRHICYLFNEYNEKSYFWEQIKLSKKTIIILIMTYFESNILLKASLLGLFLLVYQLLAGKQQPYIISSLNKLDLQTGQICSIAIFVATAKYVSEQEMENSYSEILQVIIMLLCLRLCYPFFLDIFRIYVKKYQVKMITFLYNMQKCINPNSRMANHFDKILTQWRLKENRLRTNFSILKLHLLTISRTQLKNQKQSQVLQLRSHLTMVENQHILSSVRHKQMETVSNNLLSQLE